MAPFVMELVSLAVAINWITLTGVLSQGKYHNFILVVNRINSYVCTYVAIISEGEVRAVHGWQINAIHIQITQFRCFLLTCTWLWLVEQ